MSKGSRFGMAFHQGLGFSSPLMKIPQTEAVFWPGCALLNLDGCVLDKTLTVLRRAEPDIQLACGCCGQPTVYLFPEKTEKRSVPVSASPKGFIPNTARKSLIIGSSVIG